MALLAKLGSKINKKAKKVLKSNSNMGNINPNKGISSKEKGIRSIPAYEVKRMIEDGLRDLTDRYLPRLN